ncbi:unnamed protein product [Prunus brigantina]
MPLVLRGVTCSFPGGMKTGIVGRTGSGKSTLIQTLFRIVDPASGQILIDGIDISSIGLHDLRSRLSIIPQDPTMFEGTVRSNLDPLEEYTDEQIWEALDKCQLGDEVRRKDGKLDTTVSENGENWSMGQRQLVCLGRVLLKKSKVLVLDEATASVDTATDNLIQQTLRQHFTDCTVITIAHRITSVLDSDMVLLLSHGLIEEYDSPATLLENKSSSFAQLVAEYTMSFLFSDIRFYHHVTCRCECVLWRGWEGTLGLGGGGAFGEEGLSRRRSFWRRGVIGGDGGGGNGDGVDVAGFWLWKKGLGERL